MTGRAIKPSVELSDTSFKFGEISVGDQRELSFNVTNKSEELPIQYAVQRIAHFRASPSQGKLLPLQSQEITLSFSPKQVLSSIDLFYLLPSLHYE